MTDEPGVAVTLSEISPLATDAAVPPDVENTLSRTFEIGNVLFKSKIGVLETTRREPKGSVNGSVRELAPTSLLPVHP